MNLREECYRVIELNKLVSDSMPQISCCIGFMYSSHKVHYETLHKIIMDIAKHTDSELYDYLKDFHYAESEIHGPFECNIEHGYYDPVLNMCKHESGSMEVVDNNCDPDLYVPIKKRYSHCELPDAEFSPNVDKNELKKLFEYKKMLEYMKKYLLFNQNLSRHKCEYNAF